LNKFLHTLVLVASLSLSACASSNHTAGYAGDVYDPIEPINRVTFAFNDGLDTVLLNPLTDAYRFVVPDAFRIAISNFLTNIKSPVYLANELLQGDLDGAALVTKRFVFNTFTGFGGILDTASWEGMTYEPEDFGQTLATWGVGAGPYIVWPLLGPSTARDTVGTIGDMAMDPVNWYIWNNDKDDLGYIRTGATILTTKDQVIDLQRDLKANSLDYYAATRSVWMQRRQAVINDTNAGAAYVEYE
jgi:phospholipid-binding lipoprotein MlaA